MRQSAFVLALGLSPLCACTTGSSSSTPAKVQPVEVAPATEEPAVAPPVAPREEPPGGRRVFAPHQDGRRLGISYGPFREGQAPGGPDPTAAQIEEDLRILDPDFDLIRMYSTQGPTEQTLKIIHDNKLGLGVVLGAWVSPDDTEANALEAKEAIRLANAYPDVVLAVSVGNESQVDWSAHVTPVEELLKRLRHVRENVKQPVTTADDYNFWNKPRSHVVAKEVDFILLHAYAMWNGKSLDEALPWTSQTLAAIQEEHPGVPIAIGETGWATALNEEGDERKHIKAPAGEQEQATFFAGVYQAEGLKDIPVFTFEAFDEPWKGSDDPREVEKHWGIYNVDRTPKPAVASLRKALEASK